MRTSPVSRFDLLPPRVLEVLGHLAPGALRAAGADRVVDPAVGLGGLAEAEARHVDAPGLPDDLGEGPDDRRHDRVAGPGGHRAVEAEVVAEEGLGIVEGREHAGELVRHPGHVLAGGPLGGEPGRADLQHPPRLVHLVEGEAVEGGQELEGRLPEVRRPLHDEGAGPAPRGDDAHRLQRAEPGPQRGAAHAHLQGELPLGGQAVAGAEAAGLDLPADVLDDLGAGRGVDGLRVGPTFLDFLCQDAMTNTTLGSSASTAPSSSRRTHRDWSDRRSALTPRAGQVARRGSPSMWIGAKVGFSTGSEPGTR